MPGAERLARVFAPGRIGPVELPHRIVTGAMHLNLESRPDGGAALAAFYATRARGGAGLIVTGGAAVSREGAAGLGYGVLEEPAHVTALGRVVEAVHAAGGRIALQLFHAGRYAVAGAYGIEPLAPSAVYCRMTRTMPRAAGAEDLARVVEEFAAGARVAGELGFDGVEVMASEGYLLNQFLSPVTNRRDDGWGGDPVRRRRLALEVARAVRAQSPGLALLFRISGADLVRAADFPDPPDAPTRGAGPDGRSARAGEPGDGWDGDGWDGDDPGALAVELARLGVDGIDVGIGWHESRVPTVQTVVPPGVFLPYARSIRNALHARGFAGVPVIGSNRVNRLEQAEAILAAGDADFVSMARPFLADPEIVAKYRAGRADRVNVCIACDEACIDRSLGDEPVSCLVNPRAGRELDFPEPVDGMSAEPGTQRSQARGTRARGTAGRYAVIGAGPAGLEAARALAALGARVELFEAGAELGGQFRLARVVPGKADFGATIDYYRAELARLGVVVRLNRPIGRDPAGARADGDGDADAGADVRMLRGFDGAVLASGVVPRAVSLSGEVLGSGADSRGRSGSGAEPGAGSGPEAERRARTRVVSYPEAFADPAALGRRVVVIGGGGIAVDLAHLLVEREPEGSPAVSVEAFRRRHHLRGAGGARGAASAGAGAGGGEGAGAGGGEGAGAGGGEGASRVDSAGRPKAVRVTLLRRTGRIGSGMGITTRWAVLDGLRAGGVELITGVGYRAIRADGLEIVDADGAVRLIPADTIVVAAGQEPDDTPRATLDAAGVPYRVVGGAANTAGLNAVRATDEGLRAAHALMAERPTRSQPDPDRDRTV